MQPYSDDLRQRIVQACDAGLAHRAVARRFRVRLSFVEKRLPRRRTTGTIAARPHTGGRPSPLWTVAGPIRQWVTTQPDVTVAELRERLAQAAGLTPSVAALSRFLLRLVLLRHFHSRRAQAKRVRPRGQRRTATSPTRRRRRTAGSDGAGGGPGRGRARRRLSPQPQVLEEGEGDHREQGVVVQPQPRAALEVVEAQLIFELLMRLLAVSSIA